MPETTYMNPSGIADPSPSGFTAVVKAGNTVYIAGMVAQDENGNVVGAATPRRKRGRFGTTSEWQSPPRAGAWPTS